MKRKKVVGLGGCGLDYVAHISAFPEPDAKLRTEKLEVSDGRCKPPVCALHTAIMRAVLQTHGGGNSANSLTALARLGIHTHLVTKLGDDALAGQILEELQGDGVNTEHVLHAENHPSPFTYVLCDRQGLLTWRSWCRSC